MLLLLLLLLFTCSHLIKCLLFQTPEFIFPIERQTRSLSAKMFDSVGTSYLSGE